MLGTRVSLGYLKQLASKSKARMEHTTCNSPPQYDVTEKMKKLFEIKQKQREAIKAHYQKLVMNPHRPKQDPVPFDPVLFRYNALMTYHAEYVKPNLKNMTIFTGLYLMPITVVFFLLYYSKTNQEKRLRAGEIAYKDRNRGLV